MGTPPIFVGEYGDAANEMGAAPDRSPAGATQPPSSLVRPHGAVPTQRGKATDNLHAIFYEMDRYRVQRERYGKGPDAAPRVQYRVPRPPEGRWLHPVTGRPPTGRYLFR